MLEMASLGAKVMQPNAVQSAMIDDIPINVRSTFSEKSGTKIIPESEIDYKKVVTGIAYSKNNAKVSVIGVVDKPGVAADIFEPIGKNNINIDMVIQNTSFDGKKANITFTIKREDLEKTLNIIEKNKEKGIDILLELDIQGVETLRKIDFKGIFILILPPSIKEMVKRLKNRGTDTEESIERRIKTGKEEIKSYKNFDYVITNFELEQTAESILSIIRAEKLKAARYIPTSEDIKELLD